MPILLVKAQGWKMAALMDSYAYQSASAAKFAADRRCLYRMWPSDK